MAAPRNIEQLAAFVDAQLAEMRLLLEQEHKPIFPIWAEADASLNALAYEWSFGDGLAAVAGLGVVLPFRCALIALSLSLATSGAFDSAAFDIEAFDVSAFSFTGGVASAKVEVERDAVIQSTYAVEIISGQQAFEEFPTALEFSAGSVLNFRTFSASATAPGNRVCAWMRKE